MPTTLNGLITRYSKLLETADEELQNMTPEEIRGALILATRISQFMWTEHFEHHEILNQKILVKTLDDVVEMCMEYKNRTEKKPPSDKENQGAK
jgi:hypothetical protein